MVEQPGVCVRVRVCVYECVCACVCACVCVCVCVYARAHAYTCAYMYTRMSKETNSISDVDFLALVKQKEGSKNATSFIQ